MLYLPMMFYKIVFRNKQAGSMQKENDSAIVAGTVQYMQIYVVQQLSPNFFSTYIECRTKSVPNKRFLLNLVKFLVESFFDRTIIIRRFLIKFSRTTKKLSCIMTTIFIGTQIFRRKLALAYNTQEKVYSKQVEFYIFNNRC